MSMFDKELFRKEFNINNIKIVFIKRTITGKVVFVDGKGFCYNFDENNEEQMKILTDILYAFYKEIKNSIRTAEQDDKLIDFTTLIEILNRYKEN